MKVTGLLIEGNLVCFCSCLPVLSIGQIGSAEKLSVLKSMQGPADWVILEVEVHRSGRHQTMQASLDMFNLFNYLIYTIRL